MNLIPDETPIPPLPQGERPRYGAKRRPDELRATPINGTASSAAQSEVPGKTIVAKEEKNGVTAPNEGTVAKRIWDLCEDITFKLARQATFEDIIPVAKERGFNEGNTKTEYSRWRKFKQ